MPRILLVKISSLGDIVHNLPVISDIRAALPEAEFEWVVEETFADIPALHPGVRRVIPVALRRWRRNLHCASTWREIGAFRRALRAQAYDFVLDTQGLLKSAVLARLARGPAHGQNRATAREPLAAFFYDHAHHIARGRHAMMRNRDLAAQALGYALPTTPPNYGIAAPAEAPVIELPREYVVALHSTSRDAKLWPENHWVTLGQMLSRRGIAVLLPWGSPSERERAERLVARIVVDGVPARVLPQLCVRELAVLLSQACGVVGVDSGLTHLAVALNRPTVAIYTDTLPCLTGVYPADPARAVNLGERGREPTVAEVANALQSVKALNEAGWRTSSSTG
jgi:heptosyltransferase-1